MSRLPKLFRLLSFLLLPLPSVLRALESPKYRIEGVVLSQHDGAPVPFCRLSVEAAPSSTSARPTLRPGLGNNPRPAGAGRPLQRFGRPNPPFSANQAERPRDTQTEVVADASGHFSIELPQPGAWRLTGVARGFHSQIFEEHQDFFTAIVLTPEAPLFHATFRLSPDAAIHGVILDEAGEAVRTAQVTAQRIVSRLPGESAATEASMRPVESATSDDRGFYELANLPPGVYLVRVQAQPWYASAPNLQRSANPPSSPLPPSDPSLDIVYPVTWFAAASSPTQAQSLVLSGGEQRQADFHLTPIPAVHLSIPREDPQASQPGTSRRSLPALLQRIAADPSEEFSSTTLSGNNAAGWEFDGLEPGLYQVHLPGSNPLSEGETRQLEIRPGTSGVLTLQTSTPLTRVTLQIDGVPETEIAAIEFVDPDTGHRTPALPPPTRRRRPEQDDQNPQGDRQPSPGWIALLPPHTFDVLVTARSDAYLTALGTTGSDSAATKVTGTRVTLGSGASTLQLHLAHGRASLAGFAQLPTGPAEGALVLLVPTTFGSPESTLPVLRDQANSDGSFLFSAVLPGKYILLALDHGWDVNWKDPRTLERSLLQGTPIDLQPAAKLNKTIPAQAP